MPAIQEKGDSLTSTNSDAEKLINRATELMDKDLIYEAIDKFLMAHDLDNNNLSILKEIVNLNQLIGKYKEAFTYAIKILQIENDNEFALTALVNLIPARSTEIINSTINLFMNLMKSKQSDSLFVSIGILYLKKNNGEAAQFCFNKALKMNPSFSNQLLLLYSLFAVFYSEEEDKQKLKDYKSTLEGLIKLVEENHYYYEKPKQLSSGGFDIAYHDANPVECQKLLTKLQLTVCPQLNYMSDWVKSWQPKKDGEKIKVGVFSTLLSQPQHPVSQVYRKLLEEVAKDPLIDIVTFLPPSDGTSLPMENVNHVMIKPLWEDNVRIIENQKCDVLFYTDIGMDSYNDLLAYARLAPVQCISAGHPITSGIPNLDYFISTVELEPEGSDKYYTEKVARLNGLPRLMHPPKEQVKTTKTLEDFGFSSDSHIYYCPSLCHKVHPKMDKCFKEILERDPKAILVLVKDNSEHAVRVFKTRMENAAPEHIDRVMMMPYLDKKDFIQFARNCHVILDSFPFGNGTTAVHMILNGCPIVNMPQNRLITRTCHIYYQAIGVDDFSVNSEEEFVEKALKLANDPEYKKRVTENMVAQLYKYEEVNKLTIQEFKNFFKGVVYGNFKNRKAIPCP